ncbi:MAG: transglycosylase SLT domain-containing protein [Deltaproteobacteria bacterium]|nr:transglycosylase SLT domain-containing protein [Deltaproteobacteria bacterium]
MRARGLALWMLLLAGCPRKDASVVPATDSGPPPDTGVEVTQATDGGGAEGGRVEALAGVTVWTEALRRDRYAEAEEAIAKLPAAEQAKPEVRYARARLAIALGKHADAVKLLDKLEDDLPLMRELIAKARAQAALVSGPSDRAAEWFAARPLPSQWLIAAEAYEKANDHARARALCDRVLAADKHTRSQEEKARAIRMRIVRAKESDTAAAADARWLATHALDESVASAAAELLEKLPKPAPLTQEDLVARAHVLADAGRSDDALKALERAVASKGNLTPLDLCRAKAEAYYKARTRYPEAALQYRTCSQMGGAHAAEDAFLSARAFSRADRDADAVPAFTAVMQNHAKTTWADQAEFHIARTHALAGRWKEAAHAFDEYLKHFARGHERSEALRYRAIAHLAAQDYKAARKQLEDLAGSTDDLVLQARWTNLAAFAASKDGDRNHAIARWAEVARSRPLTWPALVARARLLSMNASLPMTMEPPETGDAPEPLVVELPPPVDLLHRIGLDSDAEEALREREAIVVGNAKGRGTEALCAAYGKLDRGKRRYQISLQIPAQLLATAPGPKNRWAWDCAYPRPHREHIREHEASSKLPPDLLWAVMRQESAFDAEVVSPARAVGLLQLMPETARVVASGAGLPHEEGWLTRPPHNVALGALYLRELLDKLGNDTALASGAYNAGPEAIQRWRARAKGQTLDVFVETIPFLETRGYVVRVMGNLARYGFLDRGDAGVPRISLDLP